jgi:uroporphyrinogen-III synthase
VAVLVTRPAPDNEATAAALRAQGFDVVLAPMLRFETLSLEDETEADYAGVIATSANALRAIADNPIRARLTALPLFTVGEHTAAAARAIGFQDVVVGIKPRDREAAALPALIEAHLNGAPRRKAGAKTGTKTTTTKSASKTARKTARNAAAARSVTLLYLAGSDITRELSGELGERGFTLITHTTYRMAPVPRLSAAARDAFAADGIEAILHYSRRSAAAFLAAARGDGVEISALALPQCCLSDAVAQVMRDAGAARVIVAQAPDDASLVDAVGRVVRGADASTP